jgi:hypothetical protein
MPIATKIKQPSGPIYVQLSINGDGLNIISKTYLFLAFYFRQIGILKKRSYHNGFNLPRDETQKSKHDPYAS